MAASEKQQKMFGQFRSMDAGAYFQEEASNAMREWYRRGQRAFRECLEYGSAPQIEHFNDLMVGLKDHEKVGFCMGWQSDAWAYSNDKPFSVEGTTHEAPEGDYENLSRA